MDPGEIGEKLIRLEQSHALQLTKLDNLAATLTIVQVQGQTQNGRVSALEKTEIARLATEAERQRWAVEKDRIAHEAQESDRRNNDERFRRTWTILGFSITAAGLVSGVVFSIASTAMR